VVQRAPRHYIKIPEGSQIEFSGGSNKPLVSLKVFDLPGSEVAVLVDETIPPSTYEAYWDAANFPSGVYVYRLEVEGYSSSRKMPLLR